MLILALDTTTAQGSCAIVRDAVWCREHAIASASGHAESLPAALMTLLGESGIALRDVDLFAVATGPGSFTGLRIGIATMQGLAFAQEKPLIGVSAFDALDAIARQSPKAMAGNVATWVDAWRGEVFAALYQNGREVEPPTVSRPEAILDRLRPPILFIGDGAAVFSDLIHSVMRDHGRVADPPVPLLSAAIARLAAEAAARGEAPPPHAIRPLYVRRSDAEIVRDARTVR
jgi:tRNA threonylcarbamoyladenosine biosynthesis protein TsaB